MSLEKCQYGTIKLAKTSSFRVVFNYLLNIVQLLNVVCCGLVVSSNTL
jgi:hypothetical protein